MAARYRNTHNNSFFGNFLYQQVIDPGHFLVRTRNELDWEEITKGLESAYKGRGEYGPTPYHPALLLRYLLVPYIFNISEREAQEVVRYNLLAKYFVGLGVDRPAPDHSTLTVFKKRLRKLRGQGIWERIFKKALKQAQAKGIVFGSIQVIDSTHTTANVNQVKDKQRQKRGKKPRDPEAKRGVKNIETKTMLGQDGKKYQVRAPKRIYGYKMHTSLNSKTELITSLTVTGANEYDGHQFIPLVKKDLKRVKRIKAVAADKGYDDGSNHYFCKQRRITPAIALKKTRTQEKWKRLRQKEAYRQALKKRYQVEAKFGQAKLKHGLSVCRYLGLRNYRIQAFLTAITLNIKRMMALTTPPFPAVTRQTPSFSTYRLAYLPLSPS